MFEYTGKQIYLGLMVKQDLNSVSNRLFIHTLDLMFYAHQTIGTIWFHNCSVTNITLYIFRGMVEVNAAVIVISVLAFAMIAHHPYLSLESF